MLSANQLNDMKHLQQICEEEENIQLKLNWDMLQSRNSNEKRDFFHYENDVLVGFLALYGIANKLELCGMVHPDYRQKGIFTSLLKEARELFPKDTMILINAPGSSKSAKGYLEQLDCTYSFTEYQMKWKQVELEDYSSMIRFKPAATKDLDFLVRLDKECFQVPEKDGLAYNEKIIAEDKELFYVIEFEDEPVGKIRVSRDDSESWIYGFAIAPEFQGKGIGKKALIQTVNQQVKDGVNVFLEVAAENHHALRLYQSSGFEAYDSQDYYQYMVR
ncbi:GNAT family N-acetyltransferase [Cytobacillus spongiae]|uniref:GNAT family N-acetyltransferase n=1 Tax=Cytobacillus spongiae TaxID=2901381 RepID=UPI001F3FCF29|nr:GNAT family N-acetyltransferase [Cytobacillus spongiae]UII54405.1 GNAT family N-acetyltransferase [Cytobacillus spongiae]